MSAKALIELGRRLAMRRREARLSPNDLARRANVPVAEIDAFERGAGQLGAAALTRLAGALGVPEGSFLHTSAAEVVAHREPSFMLREVAQGAALSHADRTALTEQLYRARAFAEVGEILGSSCFARQFQPRPARQPAYSAGYDLARLVRRMLGNEQPLRELRTVIEDDFNIMVVDHRFEDPRVQAAACRSGDARLIAISPSITFEPARRATLGHELCHHLADLDEDSAITDDDDPEGYSSQRPPEEQRASAFSIMLLAPQRALAADLGARPLTREEAAAAVSRCRVKYGVGFKAMAWHLFHLGFFAFSEDATAELVDEGDDFDVSGFETARPNVLESRIARALNGHVISEGRARLMTTALSRT